MKTISMLAAIATVGLLQQAGPRGGMTLEQARRLAQPTGAEPIEVLQLEKAWAGVEPLMQVATSKEVSKPVRDAAIRALGRLENPGVIPHILALPPETATPAARASAIAQSLQGFDPAADPALVRTATEGMLAAASVAIVDPEKTLPQVESMAGPLSKIRYATAEDVHKVEEILRRILTFTQADTRLQGSYVTAIRNLESLARVNQRVTALDEDSADRLKKSVGRAYGNDVDDIRLHAFMALNSGRSLDRDTVREATRDDYWQLRRVAATVVAGAGGGLDDESRIKILQELLIDKVPQVRYEAVRGFARRGVATLGCGPIEGVLSDTDLHVVLAAIDALGDACKTDEDLTVRIAAEARVPPTVGSWHRETHAFVALAKRSPEKAASSMEAFVTHPVWWVRMYAAGAAAVAGDLLRLEKLVFDTNDNVREAALVSWRRLKKAEADPAILEALERMDVQLIHTAAGFLKDSPKSERIYKALMGALGRLTKEGKETSRDARTMVLEALAIHGSTENANELEPYLKDFDPKVAQKAAELITRWTGKTAVAAPMPYTRGWPQEYKDLRQCVSVQMVNAGTFRMVMMPAAAPIAVDHFLKLALKDKYYDGLSIHRVVPNFVLQGGSPNANEYSGAKEFMRDEIAGLNRRGTVGLSTRGRNTADAQFFINLVENNRLNGDYTVFGRIPDEDLSVVDRIQEGDVMRTINPTKCGS